MPVASSGLACATNPYTQTKQHYEYPGVYSYNRGISQANTPLEKQKAHVQSRNLNKSNQRELLAY